MILGGEKFMKQENYKVKPMTVEESRKKNKQLNEDAQWFMEHFKDKDPELVKILKNDISLMPSDVIYEEDKTEKEDFLLGEEELIEIYGKEFLEKLKKENYQAYSDLRNCAAFMPNDIDTPKR